LRPLGQPCEFQVATEALATGASARYLAGFQLPEIGAPVRPRIFSDAELDAFAAEVEARAANSGPGGPPAPLVPLCGPLAAPQSDDSDPLPIAVACDPMAVVYRLTGSYHPPGRGDGRRAHEGRAGPVEAARHPRGLRAGAGQAETCTGFRGSLEPPGAFLMHLHTAY
jgi:hypothetical protein